MNSKRLELLRKRSYRLFVIGYTTSFFGTGMQFIANAWLAMILSDELYSVAIVMGASALPGLLLSPFIGVLVDRMDRKKLIVWMDIFRAMVLLVIPILWWMQILEPWHLYLMSFLVAVGDTVYFPASMSLIREIVPSKLLLYANSTNMIGSQVGAIIGIGVGGVIAAAYPPVYVMIINSASFIISGICTHLIRKGTLQSKGNAHSSGWTAYINQLKEGFQYINLNRGIIFFYSMMLFTRTTNVTLNVLLAPFAKDTLKVGAFGFGVIDAMYAVGAIVGNLWIPLLARKRGESLVKSLGMFVLAISVFLLAAAQNLWMAMVCYLIAGVAFQIGVLFTTTAQQNTDNDFQGRVFSIFNIVNTLLSLLIYMITAFFLSINEIRWLYVAQALILLMGGIITYRVFSSNKTTTTDIAK
ncbi:MFS transporter [Bacillus mycoides]|uniref:MFS transporter n=1 Tax=Bacillus mycoides TaxID=1405 RepID=UPI00187A67AB|nr:MFS transporter [Bacillus mycoides]MBE7150058.1 MFS transporter [Bacillus mycoides]